MNTWKEIKDSWTVKPRTYVLKGDAQPPLRQIRSMHTQQNHLMHWDEEVGRQRELRYFASAKSPFVDEQPTEGITIEHIFFKEGFLFTNRQDVALQQFLSIHPDNGSIFEELVPEKEAEQEVEDFEARAKAYALVGNLSLEEIEAIVYNEVGDDVFKTSSKELKRDLWILADEAPEYLLEVADNQETLLKFIARKAEKYEVIKVADGGRTIKWGSTGKKLCAVDVDNTPIGALAAFFLTDDGVPALKKIKEKLKDF